MVIANSYKGTLKRHPLKEPLKATLRFPIVGTAIMGYDFFQNSYLDTLGPAKPQAPIWV